MKKVSAFSVFKGKKHDQDESSDSNSQASIRRAGSVPAIQGRDKKEKKGRRLMNGEENSSDSNLRGSIRRAESVPTIKDDAKKSVGQNKGKKIIKALKNSSLRMSKRGTPRASILKNYSNLNMNDCSVKLTMVRSNTQLNNIDDKQQDSQKQIVETPKLPMQVSAVKPNYHASGKPPTGKPLDGNTSPIVSTPALPLTNIKSPKSKTKPKSPEENQPKVKSPKGKLSQEESESKARKVSPRLGINATVSQTPQTGLVTDESQSAESGKRKRENKTSSAARKKKKTNADAKSVQDCSTEEICQSMSFQDETTSVSPAQTYMFDSQVEASKLFDCLIHPVQPTKFFKELWEKKPLLVKRHMPEYNNGWFSTAELDKILRERNVQFSRNLDVTTYTNGKRETHNPPGRAYPGLVWDYYQNGCSVRLLNPQTYSRNVWKLLSVLQEYFGCCVGANVYLTPAGTQGFAPHYDDIEAFILQLEGRKHWRLYSPRNDGEVLPRFSSGNFNEEELGKPILDVVLDPGDLLYFPRGTIHQGKTMDDVHSLHITVSCYQKNSWGDLFEKMLPRAIQIAMEEEVEFRQGLPLNFLNHMGIAHADEETPERLSFMIKLEQLASKLINHFPVDATVDQMGKELMHSSLPPVLSDAEKMKSVHGVGARWSNKERKVEGTIELDPDTHIKLIRKGVLRLLMEEEEVRVYHCLDNSRIYQEVEPQFFDINAEWAPGVEYLLLNYPNYVTIESLPLATMDLKIDVSTLLYEKGLLVTEEELNPIDGDD